MIALTQRPPMSETYPFPGALTCYHRANKLIRWMGGEGGYVTQHKNKKGRTVYCSVDPEMQRLIEALNNGNEETIKEFLIVDKFFDVIHAD